MTRAARRGACMTDDECLLGFLEALEGGWALPDGCDGRDLAQKGLIRPTDRDGWSITPLGQLRLQNLRSTLRFGA